MINHFIIKLLIMGFAIFLVGRMTRLYRVDDLFTAVIAAFVLALVNAIIRPIFILITIPITLLTLGIFLLFVNGIMLIITSKFIPKFKVYGCFTATIASFIITLVSLLLEWIVGI